MRPRVCRCRNPFRGRSAPADPRRSGSSVAEMISNSSARDWLKCSHSALDCSTPSASSSCLSSGTHDPHEVPAAVHDLSAGTSPQPSAIAHFRSPLVTLLHEQICAESGSAPTPNPEAPLPDLGRRDQGQRVTGQLAADHRPQHPVGRRVAHQHAAEQGLGVVGEHQFGVGLVHRVVDGDLEAVLGVAPIASPKLATSTPSSLSLVDRSASGNSAAPSSSRSATTSAEV